MGVRRSRGYRCSCLAGASARDSARETVVDTPERSTFSKVWADVWSRYEWSCVELVWSVEDDVGSSSRASS